MAFGTRNLPDGWGQHHGDRLAMFKLCPAFVPVQTITFAGPFAAKAGPSVDVCGDVIQLPHVAPPFVDFETYKTVPFPPCTPLSKVR